MKIYKIGTLESCPEWLKSDGEKITVSKDLHDRITKIASISVDVTEECENIENCAKSKTPYLYNQKWSNDVKKELKEYASVCNLDSNNFKEIDPDFMLSQISHIVEAAENKSSIIKLASVENPTILDTAKEIIADPFKLSNIKDRVKEPNWQNVAKQSILTDKPSILSNSIKAVRADENCCLNIDTKVARGTNSIADPDAIKKLTESNEKQPGEIVKERKEAAIQEKIQEKKNQNIEWQNEILKAAGDIGIIPKGKVFKTESCVFKQGYGTEDQPKMGAFKTVDPDSMPDKTMGETISEFNKAKKEAKKHIFEVKKECAASISDEFAQSLKKYAQKT